MYGMGLRAPGWRDPRHCRTAHPQGSPTRDSQLAGGRRVRVAGARFSPRAAPAKPAKPPHRLPKAPRPPLPLGCRQDRVTVAAPRATAATRPAAWRRRIPTSRAFRPRTDRPACPLQVGRAPRQRRDARVRGHAVAGRHGSARRIFLEAEAQAGTARDPALVQAGQKIFRAGIPATGVPACRLPFAGRRRHPQELSARRRPVGRLHVRAAEGVRRRPARQRPEGRRRQRPHHGGHRRQFTDAQMRAVAEYMQGLAALRAAGRCGMPDVRHNGAQRHPAQGRATPSRSRVPMSRRRALPSWRRRSRMDGRRRQRTLGHAAFPSAPRAGRHCRRRRRCRRSRTARHRCGCRPQTPPRRAR